MFEFKIKNTYKKARTGFLNTPRGKIKTPNLAIVATHGKIKLLNKTDHLRANPDLTISNTFHLFVNDKIKEIKKAGGLHKWLALSSSKGEKPIMTDSGGFQVFSLGWGRTHGIGKIGNHARSASETLFQKTSSPFKNSVQISENGAVFNFNNKEYKLTPETSIKIQQDLGADIIFAFDECTSPLHSYDYTKKSMERTHRWALRSLKTKTQNLKPQQALFGIVQGGIFEDLRKKSSKFIGSLPFDGFGIGGSFGEKQMEDVLGWALSGLPEEKPRHLLGIGKIKDIFIAVKQGIDLFDCVVPTREARHGVLYAKNGKLAIEKGVFSNDGKLIEKNCGCFVCRNGITRRELREDFKNKKIIGQKLATIHNIYFFKNLFREIREAIADKRLEKLEKEYYTYIN
ncbi:MAG: tRNA guanosine(34) transglycosylase Tgt [Patescibacteria group bacterium]